jgi:heat shock protein HslJ
MKKPEIYILGLIFGLFFSCDKSGIESKVSIYSKWEVTTFMSIESMAYSKDNNYNPTIEFNSNGSYTIKPDMNHCIGTVSLLGENGIVISVAGCTKICCDSKFSQKFIEMLPRVKTFSIEGKNLKLNIPDWGWIELEVVK